MCLKNIFSKKKEPVVDSSTSTKIPNSQMEPTNSSDNQVTIICEDNVFTLKPKGDRLGVYCNDVLVATITPNGSWKKDD